jgi:Streptomycin adenylyltransferase
MLNRRDEKIMINLILRMANDDERIRAVIINGSRTVPSSKKDIFQDYDIVYLVTDVESYVYDQNWINRFGKILIMQEPDKMDGKCKREIYPSGQEIKKWVFDCGSLATHQEGVRKAFGCYAPSLCA